MGPPSSDAEPTLRGFSAGVKVFGRYTLAEILGRGGMGVVWRAHDAVLGVDVALKFLPDAVRWDPCAYEDLKDETRRARQLTHPNIVRIHDFLEEAGGAAISMELVEGATLNARRLAKPNRIFEVEEIAAWLPQLCAALEYAHQEAKVVHRDLKPANVMLTAAGRLKVADFGVARSMADSITRVSMMSAGTLVYMSPQQAMGEEPSPADDIYAIGATLYELLTGKPPFHTGDVRMQLFQLRPEGLAARRKALGVEGNPIPPEWEAAVLACLAKEPAERPPSAIALLRMVQEPVVRPRRWRTMPRQWMTGRRLIGSGVVAAALVALTLYGPWGRREAIPESPVFPSDATRALGAWNFDGDVRDGSGRGLDGTMYAAAPTQDRFGRIDRALKFNGSASCRLPDRPEFRWDGRQPFSAAVWIRQDESPTVNGRFWFSLGVDVNAMSWALSFADGRLRAEVMVNQSETVVAVTAPERCVVGEWYHVALVCGEEDLWLYVNGKPVAKSARGATRAAKLPTSVLITLGQANQRTGWSLTGAMDDARLWRRALTAEEVAALVETKAPSRIVLSVGTTADTDDLQAAIRTEFGENARLADWNDLKRRWGDDARTGADEFGITLGGVAGWVTRDGERRFDAKRVYFVNRFDGKKPDYYTVHDEICGLTFALGSWFQTRAPAVLILPPAEITTEVLRPAPGERILRRSGGLGQRRTAASLSWRAHLTPEEKRCVTVRIRLADLRQYQAVLDSKPTSLSLALGPEGPGAASHNVPTGFGDFDFTLVLRNKQLALRAASAVGANLLFNRIVPAPDFQLDDVVAIEIEGGSHSEISTATLIVE